MLIRMSQEDYDKLDLIQVGIFMLDEAELHGRVLRDHFSYLTRETHGPDKFKVFPLTFFGDGRQKDEMLCVVIWMRFINTDHIQYIDIDDAQSIKTVLKNTFDFTDGHYFTTVKHK